ncbi:MULTISPECIES: hypothetical protein [Mameliella]|uniref:hypothetical protein n=2 Tax=Mameliella TaxID=1434019 RepID=UPI0009F73853|nr:MULTISPECIES: hypothetical protein [Mameliella]MDD9732463.1 hypothetical protein [Mameliella sp. AT18]OWV39315.1 hypothetical protein CDZ95_26905 [Mameliella alba]OWV52422.1 hypothetical protein CDZ98_25345 [Mameliella alba]OWV52477.1 hypothetical protein CDZ97_26340 [Mameliella alba]BBU53844.1 membrane protein [Mameliella alba]
MITRMVAAGARAFLVALLVATPALLMPGTRAETTQMIALIGLVAAILTLVEYLADAPSLIEFRSAPPFNRIRFFSLALTVILLTLICRGAVLPTPLTDGLIGFGRMIGEAMDFSFSPVHLMLLAVPGEAMVEEIRPLAGLAYVISLVTILLFVALVRILDWPLGRGAFNFWINLPLYDPTAGGDILRRLRRDSHVNVALGFLLPFLIPALLKAAGVHATSLSWAEPQTLIWTMSAWAFLPASLIMRGVALMRIADLIEEKRRRAYAQADLQAV